MIKLSYVQFVMIENDWNRAPVRCIKDLWFHDGLISPFAVKQTKLSKFYEIVIICCDQDSATLLSVIPDFAFL